MQRLHQDIISMQWSLTTFPIASSAVSFIHSPKGQGAYKTSSHKTKCNLATPTTTTFFALLTSPVTAWERDGAARARTMTGRYILGFGLTASGSRINVGEKNNASGLRVCLHERKMLYTILCPSCMQNRNSRTFSPSDSSTLLCRSSNSYRSTE
jgi:hypothetical protein